MARIDLILEAEPQEEQPRMVNCTTFSSASAAPANADRKTNTNNALNIFFIMVSTIIFY